ncbi:MAG: cation transporter [Clostridia bacterium]|nr:cation transporter [Clostridia bacterium]MBR4261393.1 cation transporter [Clostridia bacterium]
MKTDKNILIAFILNLGFSIFEFIGGFFTNSVAILTDSIHDMGDALSIGISYFLEKKSKKKVDNKYTYGYIRYSVLGGFITTVILTVGSILVIYNAILRIINPVDVNYDGMIIFAVIGVVLNFVAAYVTREGDSINQKSVNLHMLEDVLGWIVVLIGAVVMKFTDISIIDPIMSIGVAIFILVNAMKNLKQVLDLFLAKTPKDIDIDHLKEHLLEIKDVDDIHHIHVWSIDGFNNYATMHIVTKTDDIKSLKKAIREELEEHNICHAILETEDEVCEDRECSPHFHEGGGHGHHHHHH